MNIIIFLAYSFYKAWNSWQYQYSFTYNGMENYFIVSTIVILLDIQKYLVLSFDDFLHGFPPNFIMLFKVFNIPSWHVR